MQLAITLHSLNHISIGSDHELVTSAALGDADEDTYTIYLVNNATTRGATINGLPHGNN